MKLHLPNVVRDLPAGGRRLMQRASGYTATILKGEIWRGELVNRGRNTWLD